MLTLDLPAEPYWLDLPRGVRVEIRPVTTAVMAAARAAASRRLGAAKAEVGDSGIDPDIAKGLAFAFLVKALARHSVVAWEGVGDRAGIPPGPTPENVKRLMDLDDIASAFWDAATAPVASVAAEGNASGPAPSGTSDAGPSTAAAARALIMGDGPGGPIRSSSPFPVTEPDGPATRTLRLTWARLNRGHGSTERDCRPFADFGSSGRRSRGAWLRQGGTAGSRTGNWFGGAVRRRPELA